ncbi:MAG: tetratricopeptide repeat protein [Myxococcota bacterium]
MRLLLIAAACVAFLSSTGAADAQGSGSRQARIAQAKKAFAAGTRAYENGDFETALARFERAYELTGSPDLLYNIATVSDRMRHDEDALKAYEGYIAARPNSPDRGHVRGRIEALRASIEAKQRAALEAEIEAERAALEAADKIKAERPLTHYVGPGVGPWIMIATGSAVAVTGAVFLGLGQRDQNSVSSAPEGSTFNDFEEVADRGPRRTKTGIALLSVGAAGVLGGVIWQLTGGREEAIPEVSVGPTGISVRGKF